MFVCVHFYSCAPKKNKRDDKKSASLQHLYVEDVIKFSDGSSAKETSEFFCTFFENSDNPDGSNNIMSSTNSLPIVDLLTEY